MRFAVVIEKSETGFGAYVPDLPGCIAVGETVSETETLIKEAISFHLDGANPSLTPRLLPNMSRYNASRMRQPCEESAFPKSACFSTSFARSTSPSSTCTR